MRNYIKISLLPIFILSCLSCRDEFVEPELFGGVYGKILFSDDFMPLGNVQISTNPPSHLLITDETGAFSLDSLPVGNYTIEAKKESFRTERTHITISPNASKEINILMEIAMEGNMPPEFPYNEFPLNGALDQATDLTISWESGDFDLSDSLVFDLIFFKEGDSPNNLIAENLNVSSYALSSLEYGTTYYWQVIAKDGVNAPVYGAVWQYRTMDFPYHRIFFTREEDQEYKIFCANLAGESIPFGNAANNEWRPRMNPQGNKLAYISNSGVEMHLFIKDNEGNNPEQITELPLTGYHPLQLDFCWKSYGAELIYMNGNRLYKINVDGTGTEMIAEAPENMTYAGVDWDDANDRMVARVVGDLPYESSILLYDENNEVTTLVDESNIKGSLGNPKFSVAGNKILFTFDYSGNESLDGRQLDARIYLMDLADPGFIENLSIGKPAGTNDLDPHFDSTGAYVIFTNGANDDLSPKSLWRLEIGSPMNRELLVENAEMGDWN